MSDELPSSETVRWVIRRKAAVVSCVRDGYISLDEACSRYGLSRHEFLEWSASVRRWLERPLIK
jgi:hypothetical protein